MDLEGLFIAIVAFLFGVLLGWLVAHGAVSSECEKLGGFYVGNTTFECKVKP